MQAIYAALKDGKGIEQQYLLGNVSHVSEATVAHVKFPEGVSKDDYLAALKSDVLGTARKLIAACRVSGKCREEFVDTILEGNKKGEWVNLDGNFYPKKVLQLLRDCDTRWSSSHSMVDRILDMLPVCFTVATLNALT